MTALNVLSWQSWSKETMDSAEKASKPVFLVLTAFWDVPSTQLDSDIFSSKELCDFIQEHFTPIRMDIDQRPDVFQRYSANTLPTFAVLTPQGTRIQVTGFLPAPALKVFLEKGLENFTKLGASLDEQFEKALRVYNQPTRVLDSMHSRLTPTDLVRDLELQLSNAFDFQFAGFGKTVKFPHASVLKFLYFSYLYQKESVSLDLLEKTLKTMASSELWDAKENGFFRACAQRNWTQPVNGKSLEDNAKLLDVYNYAFQLTRNPFYSSIAEKITEHACTHWWNEKTHLFSVQPAQPAFTDVNSLMVNSFFLAGEILKKPNLCTMAQSCMDSILQSHWDGKTLAHSNSKDSVRNLLRDHVLLLNACVTAYEFTFDSKYLAHAKSIYDVIYTRFYDPVNFGFYDISKDIPLMGALKQRIKPLAENAIMVQCGLKLSFLFQDKSYHEKAMETLYPLLSPAQQSGIFGAPVACTALMADRGLTEIKIIAPTVPDSAQDFISIARSHYSSALVFDFISLTDSAKLTQFNIPVDIQKSKEPFALVSARHITLPLLKKPSDLQKKLV